MSNESDEPSPGPDDQVDRDAPGIEGIRARVKYGWLAWHDVQRDAAALLAEVDRLRLIAAAAPEMLALLRSVAACEPHDIMPVLPFELQDEVRALLARIDGKTP